MIVSLMLQEVITGSSAGVLLLLALPIHVLTMHLRHFAPLRDVQPILCMLTHAGFVLFIAHLFIAWHHDREYCVELAIAQCIGCSLLYGCFVAKHYALHKRYRIVTNPLPSHIAFTLCAFPFLVISTYRVAMKEENHCPNVDGVTAIAGGMIVVFTYVRLVLADHPSSHYKRATIVEGLAMLVALAASAVHQYTSSDPITITSILLTTIAANASFLAFVFPPIILRLRHGNEFTDETQRLTDSLAYSPRLGSDGFDNTSSFMSRVVQMLSGYFQPASETTGAGPSPRYGVGGQIQEGGGSQQQLSSSAALSHNKTTASSASNARRGASPATPARAVINTEVRNELYQLLQMIKEADVYRLSKFTTSRGLALLNMPDEDGRTPLHHAVRVGNVDVIKFLVEMGADVNAFDEKGRAPLHEAIRTKSTASDRSVVISELLQAGAVVNLPTPQGFTALHYAVTYGHLGALNTLLRHEANPLFGHDKEDRSIPWAEFHVGNCQQASVTRATNRGWGDGGGDAKRSPLLVAVEMGLEMHVSSMIHAVKHRSSSRQSGGLVHLDLRCPHGLTLLHIALAVGNANVAHVLLVEAGCNVWAINEETNQNVFHFAAIGDNSASLGEILAHLNAPETLPEDGGDFVQFQHLNHLGSDSSVPTSSSKTGAGVPSFGARGFPSARVQYGCKRSHAAAPMGFGQAIAKLREHVPIASADPDSLTQLEASVDHVVSGLRAKSMHTEVELVHQAITVVSKRARLLSSKRSISAGGGPATSGGFYGSTPAMQYASTSSSTRPSASSSVMERIRDAVNVRDSQNMTPLHYAMEQENVIMCHVLAAYGAEFTAAGDEKEDDGSDDGRDDEPCDDTAAAASGRTDGDDVPALDSTAEFLLSIQKENRQKKRRDKSADGLAGGGGHRLDSHENFLRTSIPDLATLENISEAIRRGQAFHKCYADSVAAFEGSTVLLPLSAAGGTASTGKSNQ